MRLGGRRPDRPFYKQQKLQLSHLGDSGTLADCPIRNCGVPVSGLALPNLALPALLRKWVPYLVGMFDVAKPGYLAPPKPEMGLSVPCT
jgi:hypothetical protein